MAERFFIETFGCQMNEHDSDKIAGLLSHRGMLPAGTPEEANLFILNTCSVREKAAQKVYSRLGQFKIRKRMDPSFKLGVVGCLAQQDGQEMAQRVPYLDLVVGTHQVHSIPDLLDQMRGGQYHRQQVATAFDEKRSPVEFESIQRRHDFRANVTIMEGCNKQCSFCIVPFTRGKERNRPLQLILDEIQQAVNMGYFEVLLLGQTVNSYRDPHKPRNRFPHLLEAVSAIPGLRRIRFTSPHPRHFDESTIAVLDAHENICNQVHLPVQSGASRILKRMRRQYDRDWFLGLIERFSQCQRRFSLSTDVIVGFPGETEKDFEETLSLIDAVRFESMFSFKYSVRPHTEAGEWTDDVPEQVKQERLMQLQRKQQDIQLELHEERYLGREFEVVVEGPAKDGCQCYGRTISNKIVNFPGHYDSGTTVTVSISGVGPNSLRGQRVDPAKEMAS